MTQENSTTALAELQRIFGKENVIEETRDGVDVYTLKADILKQLTNTIREEFIEEFSMVTEIMHQRIHPLNGGSLCSISKQDMETPNVVQQLQNAKLNDFSISISYGEEIPLRNETELIDSGATPLDLNQYLDAEKPGKEWLKKVFGADNVKEFVQKTTDINGRDGYIKLYVVTEEALKPIRDLVKQVDKIKLLRESSVKSLLSEMLKANIDSYGVSHKSVLYSRKIPKSGVCPLITFVADEIDDPKLEKFRNYIKNVDTIVEQFPAEYYGNIYRKEREAKHLYMQEMRNLDNANVHLMDRPAVNIPTREMSEIEMSEIEISENGSSRIKTLNSGIPAKAFSDARGQPGLRKMFGLEFDKLIPAGVPLNADETAKEPTAIQKSHMYKSKELISYAAIKCQQIRNLLNLRKNECYTMPDDALGRNEGHIYINALAAIHAYQQHTPDVTCIDYAKIPTAADPNGECHYNYIRTDTFVKEELQKRLHEIIKPAKQAQSPGL